MSGFLYYVPTQRHTFSLEEAKEAGLGYAFEKVFVARGCHPGPDRMHGMICAPFDKGVGYYPERQTWRKIPGSPCWVGYEKASPPGPEDLARSEQLSGHWVTLADGNEWLCPVARGCADGDGDPRGYIALPQTLTLGDDGLWASGDVDAKYRHLWEIASNFWERWSGAELTGESEVRFDFQGLPDAAVCCLSANYRISRAEVAALGLFDDKGGKALAILQSAVDWPAWLDSLKKKAASVGSHSDGGPVEDTPAIVQV